MTEVKEVPIEKIETGEYEQRMDKEDDQIVELAASISRIGIISPLILEQKGDSFQLVSGHRRLLAAIRVGHSTVPCIVRDSQNGEPSEVTFAENFFRKDLSPVELACAIKDCYVNGIRSVKEMAAGFNKSEHWVQRQISITGWPDDVLEAIHEGKISVSAGSNLALVTDSNYRIFLVRNAVEQGATARTTAAWLQAWEAMQPAEEAIQAEPVSAGTHQTPMVPQAPCLCCGVVHLVNELSHVPVCGGCIQAIRLAGLGAG